jgi:serine protease Do
MMPSTLFSRYRRWLGASAMAILVGIGGGSAFLAASAPVATAQVQPAAQIDVPAVGVAGFADLVEAVKPAVVSIVVEAEQRAGQRTQEFNFQFPDLPEDHPFRDFFDQFREFGGPRGPGGPGGDGRGPARRFMATGSGFAISADGYFVTNNHVVQDASKVTVILDDGDELEATVVGTDERTDLAVLKVDGLTEMPFVNFANGDVRVGDWVVAIGNPYGLGGTVTAGIVSARGRDIAGSAYGDFLQIDAAVNTGNSGGPAFDLQGNVVGVNTAIFSPNGGSVGIAFAIPAEVVKNVTSQLIEHGTVTRGFLGVGIQDVTRDIANSVGLDRPYGALVTEPSAGGPAEKAGVKSGDVIIEVDGEEVEDALDLSRKIAGKDPGTAVEITYWRGGQEATVSVTLDTLTDTQAAAPAEPTPPDAPAAPAQSSVGITLVPNSGGEGLLIQEIDPESIAAEKGFQVGDTILEVNNTPVATPEEFETALAEVKSAGRNTALVKAERDGNVRFIGLPLAAQQ